ncbi:UDP-N-acetylglucosamine 2-epimerase (non-hydrolyzing) [bacterium F11]|nr:UDP-N-acetylglucosamine 2-epimerase (non-hydrolyzing) [bacterium F11]
MKIASIVGARPQFIKLAPVLRQINKRKGFKEIVIHTGQHYDDNMSKIFFRELGMAIPRINLGVGSGTQGEQTGFMLMKIEQALLRNKPSCVIVYGDTNTTIAGALAAAKLHIPVLHVEAGLRSFNRRMPEELNRIATDHLSDILFAPTQTAVRNLRKEGFTDKKIKWVGDVMFDSALYYGNKASKMNRILKNLKLSPKNYILTTIHRAENTNHPERLRSLLSGLSLISKHIPVVMPIHPRTKQKMESLKINKGSLAQIQMIPPVGYLDMLMLTRNARLIGTDSGGLQKESYFCGVPAAVLRDETEWVELVEMGWNRIVPPTSALMVQSGIEKALKINPKRLGKRKGPFGDGKAAHKIVSAIAGMI